MRLQLYRIQCDCYVGVSGVVNIIPWTARMGLPTCLGGSLVGLCGSRFPELKVCHEESNRDAAEDDQCLIEAIESCMDWMKFGARLTKQRRRSYLYQISSQYMLNIACTFLMSCWTYSTTRTAKNGLLDFSDFSVFVGSSFKFMSRRTHLPISFSEVRFSYISIQICE